MLISRLHVFTFSNSITGETARPVPVEFHSKHQRVVGIEGGIREGGEAVWGRTISSYLPKIGMVTNMSEILCPRILKS